MHITTGHCHTNNFTAIKRQAFAFCKGLSNVTFDNGLEDIGEQAFICCALLEHIYLPPTIKKIHDSTFKKMKMTIKAMTHMV